MALIPSKARAGIAALLLAGGTLASSAAWATTITFDSGSFEPGRPDLWNESDFTVRFEDSFELSGGSPCTPFTGCVVATDLTPNTLLVFRNENFLPSQF